MAAKQKEKKEIDEFFAISQVQLKVSALDRIVVLCGNIVQSRASATEELKTALRSSVKELCKDVCDFVDKL